MPLRSIVSFLHHLYTTHFAGQQLVAGGFLLFQRAWLLQTGRISVRELWIWKAPCDKHPQIRHLTSEWDELHMDLCAKVNGFLLDAGGGLIWQVHCILLGLWFSLGLFDMTRILSVLATIMLFNILGLILLQGTSDVGKLSQTCIRLRVQVYIPHLYLFIFNRLFLTCAFYNARGLRCLGHSRVQPRRSPSLPQGVWIRGTRGFRAVWGFYG